jgi:hypothetical protein
LSEEQNARVQEVARELIAQHRGNISSAARVLKKDPSWLSRIANGKLGASLETASIICAALGRDVTSVLGIVPVVATLSEVPGFGSALALAKATLPNMYDESIWQQIGRISLGRQPENVQPWMLIQLAQVLAALNAKPLTTPPRDSMKRIKLLPGR